MERLNGFYLYTYKSYIYIYAYICVYIDICKCKSVVQISGTAGLQRDTEMSTSALWTPHPAELCGLILGLYRGYTRDFIRVILGIM